MTRNDTRRADQARLVKEPPDEGAGRWVQA